MGAPYKTARRDMRNHLRTAYKMDKPTAEHFETLWYETGVHVSEYWDVLNGRQTTLPSLDGLTAFSREWKALGGRSVLADCDRCGGWRRLFPFGQPAHWLDYANPADKALVQAWLDGTKTPGEGEVVPRREVIPTGQFAADGMICTPCDGSGMRLAADIALDPKAQIVIDRVLDSRDWLDKDDTPEEDHLDRRHLSKRDQMLYGCPRNALIHAPRDPQPEPEEVTRTDEVTPSQPVLSLW